MSADAILASGKPFNVVFEGIFDVQTSNGLNDQESLLNILSQPPEFVPVDDATVYLSMHPVKGLSSLQAILERPFIEEALGDEFTTKPNYTASPLRVHVDENLTITDMSLQDRVFSVYIGYADDDWGDYVEWFNGKTIGGVRNREELRLDLSINSPYTQLLWPTTTLSNGECSPEILGTVNGIKPVPTGVAGFYKFTTTPFTVNAGSARAVANPYIEFDYSKDIYHGGFSVSIYDGTTYSASSDGTNALPDGISDVSIGAAVTTSSGILKITCPDESGAGERVDIFVTENSGSDPSGFNYGNLFFRYEIEYRLSESSSISKASPQISVFGNDYTRNIDRGETRVIRTGLEEESLEGTVISVSKLSGNNADDIVVDILSIKRVFWRSTNDEIKVFDSDGKKIPTCEVLDVNEYDRVEGIALFDLNGNLLVSEGLKNFTMNAVGADDDILSIAAMNQIVDEATGSQASLTASFNGEQIGYYADKQLANIQHVRNICSSLDYVVKSNLTDDDLTVTRRYNRQPVDFDGVTQAADDFTISEADIVEGSIQQSPIKGGYGRFIARYNYDHANPDDSEVSSESNVKGILTKVRTINTQLRTSTDADNIASLVSRGSAETIPVTLTVIGQGLGISTNSVGSITHRDLRDGVAHITKVSEAGENTQIGFNLYV